MERDDVVKRTGLRPFRPLVLQVDDGERYVLKGPEHFYVGNSVLMTRDRRGEDVYISIASITSITELPNGRRRRVAAS